MSEWIEKQIGEIGYFKTSGVDKVINSDEKIVRLVNYMDVYNSVRIDNRYHLSETSATQHEIDSFGLKKGDVLFTPTSETPDDIGHSSVVIEDLDNTVYSYHLTRFREFEDKLLDDEFKAYCFNHYYVLHQFEKKAAGTTRFTLTRGSFESTYLRFPIDKDIQNKIAKILSTSDAVIEKSQAGIAKYKAIRQGMLQDLFTRGIDLQTGKLRPRFEDAPHLYKESKMGWIPKEWDEKVFGNEIDLIHGHQFRDYDFTEFGIPVVKIGQVKPENIDLSSCSFVAYGREEEFNSEIIRNGDVLMALTGATLGKACLVKGLNGIVLQNYRVGRFEPIIKENEIDKEFLYYLLIAGDLLTQIFNKVNTGAQGNIGKADFEKATFKKPPFDEQQKIAERLKAIDKKLQTEQTYLQKMQSLKKGLMEDLLSGRKQVNGSTQTK
jgi:type I restriction enzyme S subunit